MLLTMYYSERLRLSRWLLPPPCSYRAALRSR